MSRLFLFTIVATTIVYVSEGANVRGATGDKFITGKVTHTGANTIDANSKVHIELRDTSRQDAASVLVASTVVSDAKTFPISYTLKYNPSDIKLGHSYSMSARINGPGDKLLFINDASTPALLTGKTSPTIDIAVIRTGGSSPVKPGGSGKECAPVKCPGGKPKKCAYGYQKKDGCEICKCNDPCNPPGKAKLCGPKQRCYVDKNDDGTFSTRCDAPPSKKGKGGKKNEEKPSMNEACKEPKKIGHCRAALPRFFYNSASKSCEEFKYGGCDANANNFKTKQECEKLCKA